MSWCRIMPGATCSFSRAGGAASCPSTSITRLKIAAPGKRTSGDASTRPRLRGTRT
jgi:hypothetical protein